MSAGGLKTHDSTLIHTYKQSLDGEHDPILLMYYGPQGVAFDAAGNLLIADSSNGLIRKVIKQACFSQIRRPVLKTIILSFRDRPLHVAATGRLLTISGLASLWHRYIYFHTLNPHFMYSPPPA